MKKKSLPKVLTLNDLAILVRANSASIEDLAALSKQNSASIKDLAALSKQNSASIDSLARFVANGFDRVHEEAKSSEHRLGRKIEDLDYKIAHHATRWDKALDHIHELVQEHDRRINSLEDQVVK